VAATTAELAEPSGDAPLAFVIMPFGVVFDQIYERLFVPLLTRAGYRVRRADTLLNQQALMRDVIEGVEAADLVFADLTGGNPNVFYELGLAHARNKNTVLLAQRRDDIPSDLRGYRNHVYRVEFAEKPIFVDDLSGELQPFLEALIRGEVVSFGSPYSDFGPGESAAATTVEPEAEEGILDRMFLLLDQADTFVGALEEVGARTTELGQRQAILNDKVANVPEGVDARDHARATLGEMGDLWNEEAANLERVLDEKVAPTALVVEKGVIGAIQFAEAVKPEGAEDQLERLRAMATAAAEAAALQAGLAQTVRQQAQFAGALMRPGARLATVLERYASTFDRIGALADRISRPSETP